MCLLGMARLLSLARIVFFSAPIGARSEGPLLHVTRHACRPCPGIQRCLRVRWNLTGWDL